MTDSDNIVLIGNKPFMNYVTGVAMQFNQLGREEVVIKARGKFISRAVDVCEVARNRFLSEVMVHDIDISSEAFRMEDGKDVRVSTIAIILKRSQKGDQGPVPSQVFDE